MVKIKVGNINKFLNTWDREISDLNFSDFCSIFAGCGGGAAYAVPHITSRWPVP